jgi:hypothetical protein
MLNIKNAILELKFWNFITISSKLKLTLKLKLKAISSKLKLKLALKMQLKLKLMQNELLLYITYKCKKELFNTKIDTKL